MLIEVECESKSMAAASFIFFVELVLGISSDFLVNN